jgi:acylphosphatase
MALVTLLVRYYGHVQGVGFRAGTRAIAQGFQLKGWVKNEPDGSVQMVVTAETAELQAFLKAIRASRLGHNITREVQEPMAHPGPLDGFNIAT